jgi:hypothetical protein
MKTSSSQATPSMDGELVRLVQLDASVFESYLEMLNDPEGRWLTATKAVFSRPQIVEWLGSRATTAGRSDWAIIEESTGQSS